MTTNKRIKCMRKLNKANWSFHSSVGGDMFKECYPSKKTVNFHYGTDAPVVISDGYKEKEITTVAQLDKFMDKETRYTLSV